MTGGAVNPLTSIRLGGGVVCAPTFADEFTCPIVSTGTHTLRVDANGSGTGSFATTIQRLNDPVGCKDLPFGADGKTGSIGAQARSTAGAAPAQRPALADPGRRVRRHREPQPRGDPPGRHHDVRAQRVDRDDLPARRVGSVPDLDRDDNGLDQGLPYRARAVPDPGRLRRREIRVRSDGQGRRRRRDRMRPFPGSINDRIRVRVVVTAGTWNPLTDVMSADGSTTCAVTFADEFTCLLTSNGSHTVMVRDGAGTGQSSGQARFFLQRLNDPAGARRSSRGSRARPRRSAPRSRSTALRVRDGGRALADPGGRDQRHRVDQPRGGASGRLDGVLAQRVHRATCLLDASVLSGSDGRQRAWTRGPTGSCWSGSPARAGAQDAEFGAARTVPAPTTQGRSHASGSPGRVGEQDPGAGGSGEQWVVESAHRCHGR